MNSHEFDERRRALAAAVTELRAGIAPSRDLWPRIRAEIERGAPAQTPARASRWRTWGALAASLVLVSAAAVTAVRLRRPPVSASVPDHVAATAMLRAVVDERRAELSPQVLETLDRNLAIIDHAIGEIEATLGAAPARGERERALTALRQRKIHVLWAVTRLTS